MDLTFKNKLVYQLLIITLISFFSDFLFYNQPVGCNIAIFQALLLLLGIHRISLKKLKFSQILQLIISSSLVLSNLYEPSFLASFLFFTQILYLFKELQFPRNKKMIFFKRYFQSFVRAIPLHTYKDFSCYIKRRNKIKAKASSVNSHVASYTTWLIPISISVVFIFLFSLANPIFEIYFKWIFDFIKNINLFRVTIWLMSFIFCWSILRKKVKNIKDADSSSKELPSFGDLVILKCLALFNIIFALENVSNLLFLFSGKALPEGITYAEYVHRGAYPLIFTTLIAAAFVLIVFNENRNKSESQTIYNLLYLWIAQNIFLLFSSACRLIKYIDVYSLTEWRVASLIWLLLIAIGFLLITIRIKRDYSNNWLINNNVRILFLTLYVTSFVNFESEIAVYNIKHSNVANISEKDLDFYSLYSYGYNLIPAFDWACKNAVSEAKRAYFCIALNNKIVDNTVKLNDWRKFTFVRYFADKNYQRNDTTVANFIEEHDLNKYNGNNQCEYGDYRIFQEIDLKQTLDEKLETAKNLGWNLYLFNEIYFRQYNESDQLKVVDYVLNNIAENHPIYKILKENNAKDRDYMIAAVLKHVRWSNKNCYYNFCKGSICSSLYNDDRLEFVD